jgi:DNA-binding CsgD family transcriptional regulator/PAS domain-containing protein
MISTVELSDLLADLYAAPLQPEKWQTFLDRLCALTNVASSYMMAIHPEEGNVTLAGAGLDFNPETLRLYNQHYGANDPYAGPATANPRVGLIQAEELVSRRDLHRSELYNEVLRPYHLEHMSLLSCASAEEAGLFPFWRSPKQGPMDAASIHLIESLLPHVQTALRLRTKVIACNASEFFSETVLDAMGLAAFLVNGNGRIRHMNQLAAGYLHGTEGLRSHHGRLAARDPHEDAQLQFLIATATGEKDALVSLPGGAMKIVLPLARTSLQVAVVPAPERYRPAESGSTALVFVSDPESRPRPRAALMRQLYGLTPAEARLADLLLEGLEVREIAERVGTTLETARFHLKRVLAKTRTGRQTELMRLMLSLPGITSEIR